MAPLGRRAARRPVAPVSDQPEARLPDPRGVRVTIVPAAEGQPPVVLEPPQVPVAPVPRVAGEGLLGGVASIATPTDGLDDHVLVDGEVMAIDLAMTDAERGRLRLGSGDERAVVLLPADGPAADRGVTRREVVVDGWRFDVEVESAARAALRERASRGREEAIHSGPTEVHAIIPGVVVAVSVVPGDAVVAGQQLLVVEAMKMQNELRAPRDGTIERVAVGPGVKIEVGDLLLVIS